jgi:hypothetical protein
MLSLNGTILQSVVNSAKLASLDHPNAQRVRERAQAQGFAYFQGYRGVLGMAYLALVAV